MSRKAYIQAYCEQVGSRPHQRNKRAKQNIPKPDAAFWDSVLTFTQTKILPNYMMTLEQNLHGWCSPGYWCVKFPTYCKCECMRVRTDNRFESSIYTSAEENYTADLVVERTDTKRK